MRDVRIGICDHRHHPAQDGTVSPEKINEGDRQKKDHSAGEPDKKKNDLRHRDQLLVVGEMVGLYKIKDQEQPGDHRIIDAIFKKRIGGS